MKIKLWMIVSFVICAIGSCQYYYRDIDNIIEKGHAYGMRIGDTKKLTFSKISTHPKVQWLTIPYFSWGIYGTRTVHARPLSSIAEEFCDWSVWRLQNFSDSEIQGLWLGFENGRLISLVGREVHTKLPGYDKRLRMWPPKNTEYPSLLIGMSYDEVYTTLLNLSTFAPYTTMRGLPQNYRKIMTFTKDDWKRIQQWDMWQIALNPRPSGYGSNYIRLTFEQDELRKIRRVRHIEYPFLEPFSWIFSFLGKFLN